MDVDDIRQLDPAFICCTSGQGDAKIGTMQEKMY